MKAVLLALSVAFGQAADAAVERELTDIVQRLGLAWRSRDCDAWGTMIAPEWSVTHTTGRVLTKPQALDMCRAQTADAPLESLSSDQLSVRVYGETAVVTGRTTAEVGGAHPQTVILRFTDVYVRRGNRWQAVASQATTLAP